MNGPYGTYGTDLDFVFWVGGGFIVFMLVAGAIELYLESRKK